MTREKGFKRRVREEAKRTGKSYAATRRRREEESAAERAGAATDDASRDSTPFRLNLNVADAEHTIVVGPVGSGMSSLLATLAMQWLKLGPAPRTNAASDCGP
jgi:ABC-type transport system involved in cytochrome bd biosynthesis fused ATPase/permease subunit